MNTKVAQTELAREPEAVASSNPFKKYQVITVSLLLVIGIITSVFTGVTLTRMMVAGWLRKTRPNDIQI